MTFPVFAAGDVLRAADMNAVGLWLVKSQTIGSAVSSVTVTDAFSSSYENYRIVVTVDSASTALNLNLTLGSTATGYYRYVVYGNYNSSTLLGANTSNGTSYNAGSVATAGGQTVIELLNPQLANQTGIAKVSSNFSTTGEFGSSAGFLNDTTQYTAFTFTTSTGTITGGTVRVYGYRN